jgi:hypothetical protein
MRLGIGRNPSLDKIEPCAMHFLRLGAQPALGRGRKAMIPIRGQMIPMRGQMIPMRG